MELSQFGIDVAIVEPGGFPTSFFGNLIQPSSRNRDPGYGEMAKAPETMLEEMGSSLAANPQQKPQIVADAVIKIVNMTPGSRPFRTEVDRSGMADPIKPYNEQLAKVTEELFTSYGMEGMLKLNTSGAKAA